MISVKVVRMIGVIGHTVTSMRGRCVVAAARAAAGWPARLTGNQRGRMYHHSAYYVLLLSASAWLAVWWSKDCLASAFFCLLIWEPLLETI